MRATGRAHLGRTLRAGPLALIAVATLASGCAASGYTYVGSVRLNMVFRVPASWTTYSAQSVSDGLQLGRDPGLVGDYPFLMGFDASPTPAVQDLLSPHVRAYPSAVGWIRKLDQGGHDQMSLRTLRNAVYHVDQLEDDGAGDTLSYSTFSLPGGYWGNKVSFVIKGTPTAGADALQFSQIAATDAHLRYQYLLIVSCSPQCFARNRGQIADILNSWRLKG
jgi:hypothetical protein